MMLTHKNDRFVIDIAGNKYTVSRDDMQRAIDNACNHK